MAATVRFPRRCRAGTICCCRRTKSRRNSWPELAPVGDEIVVTKTTDSALTGTNLRLILHNLGIKNVICCRHLHRPVRVLDRAQPGRRKLQCGDRVEDCCAAGTDALHHKELEIINMIYCHVLSSGELIAKSWTWQNERCDCSISFDHTRQAGGHRSRRAMGTNTTVRMEGLSWLIKQHVGRSTYRKART